MAICLYDPSTDYYYEPLEKAPSEVEQEEPLQRHTGHQRQDLHSQAVLSRWEEARSGGAMLWLRVCPAERRAWRELDLCP